MTTDQLKPKVWVIITHEQGDTSTIHAVCSSEDNAMTLIPSYPGAEIESFTIDEKIRPGFDSWIVRVDGQIFVDPIDRRNFDPKFIKYEKGDFIMHLWAKSKDEAKTLAMSKFAKLKEIFNDS